MPAGAPPKPTSDTRRPVRPRRLIFICFPPGRVSAGLSGRPAAACECWRAPSDIAHHLGAVLGAVPLHHRLQAITHPIDFGWVDLVDLHAGFDQVARELLVLCPVCFALHFSGLQCGRAEDFLLYGGQAIPKLLAYEQDEWAVAVARQAQVLLNLGEAGRGDNAERVLLTIHRPRLQGSEQFRERQRNGAGPQGIEHVEEHWVLHHADLLAGDVLEFVDRPLGRRDVAKTVLPVRQANEPLRRQAVKEPASNRAVQQGVCLLHVVEQEREVKEAELFDDVARLVVAGMKTSCTPPCRAPSCWFSFPSCALGKTRTLSLPPERSPTWSAKALAPRPTGCSMGSRMPTRMVRSLMSWAWAARGSNALRHSANIDRRTLKALVI
jgi:hypothetical protein